MKKELELQLQKECPNLYGDLYGDPKHTCMAFGIETGDGWFDLIRNLSLKLEAIIMNMPEDDRKSYKAAQVKEKFATLRYYMDSQTKEMDLLIEEAEELSAKTCEECGKPGKVRGKFWLRTTCEEHDK